MGDLLNSVEKMAGRLTGKYCGIVQVEPVFGRIKSNWVFGVFYCEGLKR
jgi:hypothetical protein